MKRKLRLFIVTMIMLFAFSVPAMAEILEPMEYKNLQDSEYYLLYGSYLTQAQEALDYINQIRYEACTDGNVPDPRNESRYLTPDDYSPLKWSTELEQIARMRAAEAAVTIGHVRTNGEDVCLSTTTVYNGAEDLAWNYSNTMKSGIKQFYDEKSIWVNGESGVTGHYTSMINPYYEYVGVASFISDDACFNNSVCLRLGNKKGSATVDETMMPAKLNVYQKILVKNSYISGAVFRADSSYMAVGEKLNSDIYAVVPGNEWGYSYLKPISKISATYSSSDASIASVSGDGVIKGVAAGTATIYAKLDDGTSSFDIRVYPERSEITKCYNSADGVVLEWKKITDDFYRFYLYRAEYGSEDYSYIYYGTDTKYIDDTAVNGKKYKYRICYIPWSTWDRVYGNNTSEITRISKTEIKGISNYIDGVRISWKKVNKATSYYIYRGTSSSNLTKIAAVTKDVYEYIDTTAVSGKTYVYAVRAVAKGSVSAAATKTIKRLSAGNLTMAASRNNGVKLVWDKVSEATSYRIYRIENGGTAKLIKSLTGNTVTTFIDNTVENCKVYTYYVSPYNGTYAGGHNRLTVKFVRTTGISEVKKLSEGQIKVTWQNASDVSGYQVLYSTSSSFTSYKSVKLSSASGKVFDGLTAGKTYYFKIRTYTKNGDEVVYSSWSLVKSLKI